MTRDNASVADILERAADLIEPEGAWHQGSYGNGGLPTCMGGAVNLARGLRSWDTPEASDPIVKFLAEFTGSVSAFNDAPERTQAEVVSALRQAAAKARGPSR